METISDLYGLMHYMLKAAKQDNQKEVNRLNPELSVLMSKLEPVMDDELYMRYNSCRNSCCCSVGMSHDSHDALVEIAEREFSQIPEPEKLNLL